MKTLAIGIVLALAGTAYADQCEWVPPKLAAQAQTLLESHPQVIQFCEPCGDQAPGAPQKVTHVETVTPDGEPGYREVLINGHIVDLAYTYVEVSPRSYRNLGLLIDCDATNVSESLDVDDATPNGVLIMPDATPPPKTAEPPAPPPVPAPQIILLETHPTYPWALICLAAVTGFGATLFGVLSLAALRRYRRGMRPRASDLRPDK